MDWIQKDRRMERCTKEKKSEYEMDVSQYTDTFTCHLITSKDVNLNDYNDRGKHNRMEDFRSKTGMKLSAERLL